MCRIQDVCVTLNCLAWGYKHVYSCRGCYWGTCCAIYVAWTFSWSRGESRYTRGTSEMAGGWLGLRHKTKTSTILELARTRCLTVCDILYVIMQLVRLPKKVTVCDILQKYREHIASTEPDKAEWVCYGTQDSGVLLLFEWHVVEWFVALLLKGLKDLAVSIYSSLWWCGVTSAVRLLPYAYVGHTSCLSTVLQM